MAKESEDTPQSEEVQRPKRKSLLLVGLLGGVMLVEGVGLFFVMRMFGSGPQETLAEMTEDGITGYIIPPQNPPALANALVKCFRDDNYDTLSKNARRVAKEKYNWRRIAQETARLYQDLAN